MTIYVRPYMYTCQLVCYCFVIVYNCICMYSIVENINLADWCLVDLCLYSNRSQMMEFEIIIKLSQTPKLGMHMFHVKFSIAMYA